MLCFEQKIQAIPTVLIIPQIDANYCNYCSYFQQPDQFKIYQKHKLNESMEGGVIWYTCGIFVWKKGTLSSEALWSF